MISCITTPEELKKALPPPRALTEGEEAYFTDPRRKKLLPLRITSHFLSLMGNAADDPIRLQAVPRREELEEREYELDDPLGEDRFSPLPGLVHHYRDRVLIKMTDLCAMNCRHCFRRSFTGKNRGPLSSEAIDNAAAYLSGRPEVREILLSGGDVLTMDRDTLADRLERLRGGEARGAQFRRIFRICSRIPVVFPGGITEDLITLLQKTGPHWLITQVNHPRELSPATLAALARFVDAGIPVANQAVLLKGVNDRLEILEELFTGLAAHRIKPYYLFQGDLARGTSHFRVPLVRGLKLAEALGRRISGLAMPVYTVDLPGGGGKISLTPRGHRKEEGGFRYYRGGDGKLYGYPLEEEEG